MKPVQERSQSLIEAKREYDTAPRELHPVEIAAVMLRSYFEETPFSIRADHKLLN